MTALLIVLVAVGALVGAPVGRAEPWRADWAWPVGSRTDPPTVITGFAAAEPDWLPGHRGVDLEAAPGRAVRAPAAGVVVHAGPVAHRGVVSIDHPSGVRTTYEPMDPEVSAGSLVHAGQVIGTVAAPSDTGAAHISCGRRSCLHWGARHRGRYLDPLGLIQPPPVRLLVGPVCWSCTGVGLPIGRAQPVDRYVRVPLGGRDGGVAQQLGDRTKVGATLEQVGSRRVS